MQTPHGCHYHEQKLSDLMSLLLIQPQLQVASLTRRWQASVVHPKQA